MTPGVRNAWVDRVAQTVIDEWITDVDGIFVGQVLCDVRAVAKRRDPLIDPQPGDRIFVPHWSADAAAEITVTKRMKMRQRGCKRGSQTVPHVAARIALTNSKRDPRGNNFTLSRLQERFVAGGAYVIPKGTP